MTELGCWSSLGALCGRIHSREVLLKDRKRMEDAKKKATKSQRFLYGAKAMLHDKMDHVDFIHQPEEQIYQITQNFPGCWRLHEAEGPGNVSNPPFALVENGSRDVGRSIPYLGLARISVQAATHGH